MKTKNYTKSAFKLVKALVLCLFFIQTAYAQREEMTLNFSGRDSTSGIAVPLQSVQVNNLTQGSDTTVYGDAPTLLLQWTSGLSENNQFQNASFTVEPVSPNPFAGKAQVNIKTRNRQRLQIVLYSQQGAVAKHLEKEFSVGMHRLELSTPQNGLCLLSVSDGKLTRTLKLLSTSGNNYHIEYLGVDEDSDYKSTGEITRFVFEPGDIMQYTVHATGYYEHIAYDTPAESTDYVFDLQANTSELPPTISTSEVINITSISAVGGGNVSSQGSDLVTARGVCWNTLPNPSIENDFTVDGTGTGTFASSITGLSINTTYYVRAYATNSFGTAYGNEVSFTTASQDLAYQCDSAISYYTWGGGIKTIFIRDAENRLLKELQKILYSGNPDWVNSSQLLYSYDSLGNMLTTLYQEWNSDLSAWVNQWKHTSTYDASGNRLLSLHQEWDYYNGAWKNIQKFSYTYDASGNRLTTLIQEWDTGIGDWKNKNKTSYTYDTSGNMLTKFYQEWDSGIGDWKNKTKTSYTYDTSGNRLTELYQEWDTSIGDWKNKTKTSYTYDTSGNRLTWLYQEWDTGYNNWINDFRFSFTYDTSGNMLTELSQEWNTINGTWKDSYKYIYTYDASGNRLTFIEQKMYSGLLENYSKNSYTYNASGNMITNLSQVWNSENDEWVNNRYYSYTYDASGNRLLELSQKWLAGIVDWVNVEKTDYVYDYNTRKVSGKHYYWQSGQWEFGATYIVLSVFDYFLFYAYTFNLEAYYSPYVPAPGDKNLSTKGNAFTNRFKPGKDQLDPSNLYEKDGLNYRPQNLIEKEYPREKQIFDSRRQNKN